MTFPVEAISALLVPLTSPFFCLAVLLAASIAADAQKPRWLRLSVLPAAFASAWALYRLAADAGASAWLARLDSPLFPALLGLALPAMFLPRNRWYPVFLLAPAACVGLAVAAAFRAYGSVPEGGGFHWLLIRPSFLVVGATALLVLAQPLLPLGSFRRLVRGTAFLVLMFGGFMFRQDYADYREMVSRRTTAREKVLVLGETVPSMRADNQVVHLPGAPCRFSADGGYVQGCNLELWQRLMQVDFGRAAAGDPGERNVLTLALASATVFLFLCFVGARWWCGWICPLSTLGGALDWVRRRLGLDFLKPSEGLKTGFLAGGLSLAGLGLLLARLYPGLDAGGRVLGCKIPVYPFCKLCPGQSLCPVASQGPQAFPPLPGMEWLFGFFRIGVLVLLGIYLFSFAAVRRLWCRFCPMGMIAGLFNKGGLLRLEKEAGKCNRCGVCSEVCPMDIDVVRAELTGSNVSSYHCVLCLKCVEHCPRDGCLGLRFAGGRVVESRFAAGGKAS